MQCLKSPYFMQLLRFYISRDKLRNAGKKNIACFLVVFFFFGFVLFFVVFFSLMVHHMLSWHVISCHVMHAMSFHISYRIISYYIIVKAEFLFLMILETMYCK